MPETKREAPPKGPVAKIRKAMADLAQLVLEYRQHAGLCLPCAGTGEFWAPHTKFVEECPICRGHGVLDCNVVGRCARGC